MSTAKFKSIRESLGLKVHWIAGQAGVPLRMALYWEVGRMAMPPAVAKMLTRIH